MKTEIKESCILVIREAKDKKYYGDFNAKGESNLLYALKKHLNAKGFNLIKKRMWRDGHLVDDCQQYLRTAKKTNDPHNDVMIYNSAFQIKGANDNYNKGQVVLSIERNIFEGE